MSKEDITLETPIPKMPEKCKRPDENERKNMLDKLNQRENDQREKNNQLWVQKKNNQNMIKSKMNPEVVANEKIRGAIMSERQKLIEENKGEQNQRKDIENKIKAKQEAMPDKIKKAKGNMPKDEKELNKQIADINQRMSTQSLSIKEEKDMVKQVQELDKLRHQLVGATSRSSEVEEQLTRKKALGEHIKERSDRIKELSDQALELKKSIDLFQNEKNKEINEVYAKKESIEKMIDDNKAEMDTIKEERRKQLSEYNRTNDHQFEYQKILKHIDWIKRVKEGLKRDIERANRDTTDMDEPDIKTNPNQQKIDYINNLLIFLKPYLDADVKKNAAISQDYAAFQIFEKLSINSFPTKAKQVEAFLEKLKVMLHDFQETKDDDILNE